MSESEIQPLVSLILRRLQVLVLLWFSHGIPLCRFVLISQDVVDLQKNDENGVEDADAEERFVAFVVVWLVIGLVDLSTC